ncbi:MAG: nucleotide exchange factor GrpE [Clostridia bacterium]|nr:nucleotide exchange factor GrpE [Clostridia bacterium]
MSEEKTTNTEETTENTAPQPSVEELTQALNDATAQNTELNDKYLRTLAEYENFRKRTQREREGIYADAYMDAVSKILPIIDNIERMTAFTSDEKMSEGIKLIIASMKETLSKMGVTEIETTTFDPNYHNAVMHIDDESLEEGAIVEVFQKGYMYKERVIRYAMVKVAN